MTSSSNLVFTSGTPGDAAETIAAASGATFDVTCNANNCTYSINVPANMSMTGAGTNIGVNTFTKNSGSTFKCNNAKVDTFTIGGTRAILGNPQTSGNYSGTFTVTGSCCGNPTANGTAAITVIQSIGVAKVADLSFGQAAPGDSSKVVSAGSGANFTVSGEANTAYTITLPVSATMTTGAGTTADTQIAVTSFTSSPSATGTIGGGGSQTLRVGATRAAIRATQTAGAYTASFTVTVTY